MNSQEVGVVPIQPLLVLKVSGSCLASSDTSALLPWGGSGKSPCDCLVLGRLALLTPLEGGFISSPTPLAAKIGHPRAVDQDNEEEISTVFWALGLHYVARARVSI